MPVGASGREDPRSAVPVASKPRRNPARKYGPFKQAYPDEVILRKKLAGLNENGGVDAEMPMGFFLRALTEFA